MDCHNLFIRCCCNRGRGYANPDIYVASQVVPVKPAKKYRLTGYIKTENITTKNSIFMDVRGKDCGLNYLRTELLTGTNLWNRPDLEFRVPSGCDAVRVGILTFL